MSDPTDDAASGMRDAWDAVARTKYRGELEEHLRFLARGRHNLLKPEAALLQPLLPGAHAVHLQCSHGLDTLGLLNAGARRVSGIDISPEMIAQAREKTERLEWTARFYCRDAVDPPGELEGTADLVYTGRGALPWIHDLGAWAEAVKKLLRPGGHLFLFEGHPLNELWQRDVPRLVLRESVGYFDEELRECTGFPATAVRRALDGAGPVMLERFWRPGEVIEALLDVDLGLRHFGEHPVHFWDQFPEWPDRIREALPQSYSVLARR